MECHKKVHLAAEIRGVRMISNDVLLCLRIGWCLEQFEFSICNILQMIIPTDELIFDGRALAGGIAPTRMDCYRKLGMIWNTQYSFVINSGTSSICS